MQCIESFLLNKWTGDLIKRAHETSNLKVDLYTKEFINLWCYWEVMGTFQGSKSLGHHALGAISFSSSLSSSYISSFFSSLLSFPHLSTCSLSQTQK